MGGEQASVKRHAGPIGHGGYFHNGRAGRDNLEAHELHLHHSAPQPASPLHHHGQQEQEVSLLRGGSPHGVYTLAAKDAIGVGAHDYARLGQRHALRLGRFFAFAPVILHQADSFARRYRLLEPSDGLRLGVVCHKDCLVAVSQGEAQGVYAPAQLRLILMADAHDDRDGGRAASARDFFAAPAASADGHGAQAYDDDIG